MQECGWLRLPPENWDPAGFFQATKARSQGGPFYFRFTFNTVPFSRRLSIRDCVSV